MDIFKRLGNKILIPRVLGNLFRSGDDLLSLGANKYNGFDNLNEILTLLSLRFSKVDDIIKDTEAAIDRNSIKIDTKNDKINFYAYSDNLPEIPGIQNKYLKKSMIISESHINGIMADEDSGIEINEITEDNKNIIKLNFDDTKLKGIKFISSKTSSIKIIWDDTLGGYVVDQNDILIYESAEPELEIIIDHNLGTRAIDIKTFKILDNDVDLKYPIITGMEFPSDNQIRLYLTDPQRVHVIISRL